MKMLDDGENAVGLVTFGAPFEGGPGCVHGGLVAAVFDQLLGYLLVSRNIGALTGSLTVKYRAPTPLHRELRLVAKLDRMDGRKRWVSAQCFAGDQLTAEAEGLFISLPAGRMQAIADERAADLSKE
jgi:acyl-coenzyme A thioesterase PaaI-like protein